MLQAADITPLGDCEAFHLLAEACYLGWQESLALLTLLVEPEIPG